MDGLLGKMTKLTKKLLRTPRIELGSTAWKATMLTITPRTLIYFEKLHIINLFFI